MADDTLTLSLDIGGDVVIKLRPDLAPGHVERIIQLAKDGFYDGVVFHRVIPGFMAQGGDPTGTGMGGRSEEHTSELQSLMRISYAVFCLKKKTNIQKTKQMTQRY